MKIIDTHVHIWDIENISYDWLKGDTTILNNTYQLAHIEDARIEAGVSYGVLVQADNHLQDSDWMLKNAASHEWIKGVVGWMPLENPQLTSDTLDKYLKNSYFKGVRHLIHDEKDPQWLLQETVIESLKILADKGVTYDVVGVLPEHIQTVLAVAEKVPNLKMVFDHLNHPPIKTGEQFGKWGDLIRQASSNPNFHAKISGLGTCVKEWETWGESCIEPYVVYILELFGEDRCFCGGDWPVSLLAASYSKTWSIYQSLIKRLLPEAAQEKVFFSNANSFYRLGL